MWPVEVAGVNVCFWPKADISRLRKTRLLSGAKQTFRAMVQPMLIHVCTL